MKRLNLRGSSKVLSFIFLMLLIAGIVYAQSVDIGSCSGSPDTDVTLPIMLNYEASTPNISAICIHIGFDSEVLEYVSIQTGPAADEAEKEVMANLVSPNLLRVAILGYNQNIIQDGIVAYVTFHIKPTAFGDIILTNTPSATDPNGDPVTVTGANGTVNIVKAIQPDIKANGSDDPIILNYSHTLSITVALNNNGITKDADWWLAADTPFGLYFYTLDEGWTDALMPGYQGQLFNLNPFEVLNMPIAGLPAGTYTLYFGVDTVMDGDITWDKAVYDVVEVNITE